MSLPSLPNVEYAVKFSIRNVWTFLRNSFEFWQLSLNYQGASSQVQLFRQLIRVRLVFDEANGILRRATGCNLQEASMGAPAISSKSRQLARGRPFIGLFITKSEQNSGIGVHEHTDLVECLTIHYTIRNLFIDTEIEQ